MHDVNVSLHSEASKATQIVAEKAKGNIQRKIQKEQIQRTK